MLELFGLEAETQRECLTEGLLALERDPSNQKTIEMLMRAAHSIKGAARIVNLDAVVKVAHSMEDAFGAVQKTGIVPGRILIDLLLRGVDFLKRIVQTPAAEMKNWDLDPEVE